jgi:hypothetical protein
MKKNIKIMSITIVLVLIIGVFCGTSAFAASGKQLSFYPTGQRSIDVDEQDYFQVLTSAEEPPTVKSSDDAILKVELDKLIGDATLKTYQYRYKGLKSGTVTVTVNSKDGLTTKETFKVNQAADYVFKSDTTGNLNLKQGSSYCIRIAGFSKDDSVVKPVLTASGTNVLKTQFVNRIGSNFYYKITAIGKVGQTAYVYTSALGVAQVTQCKVTIVSAEKKQTTQKDSKVKCDTYGEFGIEKGASYCFKLTVSKGIEPSFAVGSKGIFTSKFVKRSGDYYYYKITAIGNPGQSAGIYTAAPDEKPIKQCKVTIKQDQI